MSAKALYTDNRTKIIQQLLITNDIDALLKLQKDRDEYVQFSSGWTAVNLDEYIGKFKIKDDKFNMETGKRKISFFDDGKEFEIVCSVGASYFRILRKAYTDLNGVLHGNTYVTLDLKEPRIPKGLIGNAARDERNRLTHFKMTRKKGGTTNGY